MHGLEDVLRGCVFCDAQPAVLIPDGLSKIELWERLGVPESRGPSQLDPKTPVTCSSCWATGPVMLTESHPDRSALEIWNAAARGELCASVPRGATRACPFCKTSSSLVMMTHHRLSGTPMHVVQCGCCGAQGPQMLTEQGAKNFWNRGARLPVELEEDPPFGCGMGG